MNDGLEAKIEAMAIALLSEGSYPWIDTVGEMIDEIKSRLSDFGF